MSAFLEPDADAGYVRLPSGLIVPDALAAAAPSLNERSCRSCGCTDNNACRPFGCYWVEADLCSACVMDQLDGEGEV
jgi:hypothetical protein